MSHVRSPILSLENAIAGSAFRIAPERESELARWRDANDLKLLLVDEPGFAIRVRLSEREVVINIASLEFLWASAHAHIVLYAEYCSAQRSGSATFDTGGSDRSRNALDLLAWAGRNLSAKGTERWPDNLPRPVTFPANASDAHIANELFLCAIAWIVHHEIAHIRLNHRSLITARSVTEEKEADVAATIWILEKSEVPQESRKRTLGIAAAILAMQGFDNPTQFEALRTHPATFERIDYCLTAAGIHDDDEVFAFVAVIIQIQLANRGIEKKFDGNSLRELYSEYLFEFARAAAH